MYGSLVNQKRDSRIYIYFKMDCQKDTIMVSQKHKTMIQCCFNFGPPSTTLAGNNTLSECFAMFLLWRREQHEFFVSKSKQVSQKN